MKLRVVLLRQIPNDLRSIVEYLEQHNRSAADRFVEAVFAALDDLAAWPGKGSPNHCGAAASRASVHGRYGFGNYLVLYRQVADAIDVLAIVHGSRRIRPPLLGRI